MFNNQQLYLVNHFALLARRHGIALPDLKELLQDESQLRAQVEAALVPTAAPAVADAARKLAVSFAWPLSSPAAGTMAGAARPAKPPAPLGHASERSAAIAPAARLGPSASPMTGEERTRATAALRAAAGPIADFIVAQIDDADRMTLRQFVDQTAALAQLSDDRRRTLRAACGLSD